MSVLAIRAEQADGGAEQAVRRFFECFCLGRLSQARQGTHRCFEWFGRQLCSEDWDNAVRFTREQPMQLFEIRRVPAQIIGWLSAAAIAAMPAPIGEAQTLWLVDVKRGDTLVTVGVVVEGGAAPRVRRIFDPTALAEQIRQRAG